jgi:class 3 adenylate cyclase/tetratricopeptide (TPR) repeat protein
METGKDLERFVPHYAVALRGDSDARWATIEGTLCHIDISGFTSLSERLAERGRVGAEELTEVLDSVFGSMLNLVEGRGGTLLKFGGDALLLLFEGDDHALQAASAAVEMRAALRAASKIPTSVGRLALKMSIGLHSGDVHLFRASGTHTELIVAGPAASIVMEMEETASAGEIVISAATRTLLPAEAAPEAKGDGWLLRWRKTRVDAPGRSDRLARADVIAHVPTALRSHLTDRKSDSEHRLATVAFVEFVGIDGLLEQQGGDAVSTALDGLISAITTIADEEGITFLGTDADRDAGKIILVSGVPVTLVDESGRVLRAARRIADIDSPFGLKIGVNRGHVFSGEIGTEHRSTYTIMGDTVNLSARLMAAAPIGSIYATTGPLDESRTIYDTEALDPISVKGKTKPVLACDVRIETGSRADHATRDLLFSGREAELQAINAAVEDLEKSGTSITIHGPTGIGKSRLLEESLADTDLPVFEVRSEPYGAANPFRPLRDPVRSLLGVERGSNEEMSDMLLSGIQNTAPKLLPFAPLIGDLAHIDVPETEVTRAIDSRYRQNRVIDIAVELFGAATDGRLIIVAEDMHWADGATLSLLERLRRESEQRRWLVLTTSRNEPDESDALDIGLLPLDPSVVESLVHSAMEASPLRMEDVAVVVERSGGNPFFVEELLKVVRETGDIESLPNSLDGVVGSQIDALEPLARRVLRYLSVLGRSFRSSIASDLIKTQDIELNAATREILRSFLDDDGADRLQFRHALIRDVAYEGLSYRRRKDLHNRAGHLVLERAGTEDEAVADILALHFSLGGDHALAWKYCRIAGNHNMEVFANTEAAVQFERAIDSGRRLPMVTDEDRRELWIKLGDVRERSGVFDGSLDAYRQASHLAGGDTIRRAEIQLMRARAKERAGAYGSALGETTRVKNMLSSSDSRETKGTLANVYGHVAMIRQAQQKPRPALEAALASSDIADEIGDTAALARAWTVMDWAHHMLGEPGKAVYSVKAIEIYRRNGDLASEAAVSTNMGGFAYFDGEWTQALDYYERGRETSARAGNALEAAHAAANIGEVLLNQGRYEDAEGPLNEARRSYMASGFSEGVVFTNLLLGRMYGIRGTLEKSEDALEGAIAEASSLGLDGWNLEAAIYLADARCRAGSPVEGVELLDEAERAAPLEFVDYYAPLLSRIRGSVLDSAGQRTEAIAVLVEGIEIAKERDDDFEHGLLVLAMARVDEDRTDAMAVHNAKETLRSLGVRSVSGVDLAR